MSNIIKSARLIFVSVSNNNNKFYYIDLFDNDQVQIRYGRYIEENGELKVQSDTTSPGGEGMFDRKLREKTNKGYKPQPVLEDNSSSSKTSRKNAGLEEIALSQIRTKSEEVRALITYLCNINIHNIVENSAIKYNKDTGLFSTPSGLITVDGIRDGRELLSKIKDKVDKQKWDAKYVELLDQYLTIVPRDIGRRKTEPKELFPDDAEIQKQAGILDSLEASLTTYSEKKAKGEYDIKDEDAPPPPPPQLFDTAVELLEDQAEFDRIKEHFEKSAKTEHQSIKHLTLKRVYQVEIAKMKREYDERGAAKGNVHRLWHGTSAANVLSIFKSGFMLTPPSSAHIAGKAFGNGLYFAPASTKSLQYAGGFWGGKQGKKTYMFLNDIAVGKAFEPKTTTSSNPPAGYDSYWARAGKSGWLINDEVIVFDAAQVNPVYLLEFE